MSSDPVVVPEGKLWIWVDGPNETSTIIANGRTSVRAGFTAGISDDLPIYLSSGTTLTSSVVGRTAIINVLEIDAGTINVPTPPIPGVEDFPTVTLTSTTEVIDNAARDITFNITIPHGYSRISGSYDGMTVLNETITNNGTGDNNVTVTANVEYIVSTGIMPRVYFTIIDTRGEVYSGRPTIGFVSLPGLRIDIPLDSASDKLIPNSRFEDPLQVTLNGSETVVNAQIDYRLRAGLNSVAAGTSGGTIAGTFTSNANIGSTSGTLNITATNWNRGFTSGQLYQADVLLNGSMNVPYWFSPVPA